MTEKSASKKDTVAVPKRELPSYFQSYPKSIGREAGCIIRGIGIDSNPATDVLGMAWYSPTLPIVEMFVAILKNVRNIHTLKHNGLIINAIDALVARSIADFATVHMFPVYDVLEILSIVAQHLYAMGKGFDVLYPPTERDPPSSLRVLDSGVPVDIFVERCDRKAPIEIDLEDFVATVMYDFKNRLVTEDTKMRIVFNGKLYKLTPRVPKNTCHTINAETIIKATPETGITFVSQKGPAHVICALENGINVPYVCD
jgi:hypothetical protein